MTYEIPEHNLTFLKEKIGKLNRKATKLNCLPITINIIREFFKERSIKGTRVKKKFFEVEVIGSDPIINGWQFAATIQHEDGVNIFLKNPHFESTIPQSYSNISQKCDHCGIDRYRKDTYILFNQERNLFKQVGRTCLKDFLGHTSPETYALWSTIEFSFLGSLSNYEDENFGGSGFRSENYIDINDVLILTAMYIRLHGWVSRTKARENENLISTSHYVMLHLFDINYKKEIINQDKFQPTDKDREIASQALEWSLSLDVTTDDNYLWNIKTLSSLGHCRERNLGLTCSIIAAYYRHLRELSKIEEQKHISQSSNHIGTIGQRAVFQLKVLSIKPFINDWGTKYLIRFEDADSNIFIWWACNCPITDETIGQQIHLKATIKNHSIYKFIKQTELTRGKLCQM